MTLALLLTLLGVSMGLVAWAAWDLGGPAGEKPRRPLPFPRKRTIPRHADWGATTRLVPLYVDDWEPPAPPPQPWDPDEELTWSRK